MCGEISANKLRELFSDIEVIAEKGNLDIGAQLVTIEQMIPRLVEDIARAKIMNKDELLLYR